MSSIKLSPNASGTGEFTIAAPNSNTNRTLTLPDQTGTVLTGSGPISVNASAPTSAVTLDASGNLGVGTTSPTWMVSVRKDSSSGSSGQYPVVQINNANASGYAALYLNDSSAQAGLETRRDTAHLGFYAGGNERARIDSSGNLLVGCTSGDARIRAEGGAGNKPIIYAYNTNGVSGDVTAYFALGNNSNNTSSVFLNCTNPGVANRFLIYGNGTYATVSDQRLKKNIESARDGYLADAMKLRVVKYNWNSQEDGEAKELGWIAQEVEQVFPGLIQESTADGADTAYKQVKASVLPFILLKAIQEQQMLIEDQRAIINQLTARIDEQQTALEALDVRINSLEAK